MLRIRERTATYLLVYPAPLVARSQLLNDQRIKFRLLICPQYVIEPNEKMMKDAAAKKRGTKRSKRAIRSVAGPSYDSDTAWGSKNRRIHQESLRKRDNDSVSSLSDDNGEKRRRRSVSTRNEVSASHKVPGDGVEDPSVPSPPPYSTNPPFLP